MQGVIGSLFTSEAPRPNDLIIERVYCIFPYFGYSIQIVWIYYGFIGAMANLIVWILLFFPVLRAYLCTDNGREPGSSKLYSTRDW
jgi:hypothetical protein